MWSGFLDWMAANRIGDLASFAGLLISLIGFAATLYGVVRSKAAAERAEAAAKDARESIRLFDIVVDFSAAIAILDEIKRAQRQGQWSHLPDRYSTIRRLLISLRSSDIILTLDQQEVVRSAIGTLSGIERAVERSLGNPAGLNAAKFNALISDDVDRLHEVLVELKKMKTGG